MRYWMIKVIEGKSIILQEYEDSVPTGMSITFCCSEDFQFYANLARTVLNKLNFHLAPSLVPHEFDDNSFGDVGC